MTSSKNLMKIAKKWQKLATIRKRRARDQSHNKTCLGHFVVYTADQRRLVVPLACLDSEIFRQLLKLSEDEFGLPACGPITLPCDAVFVDRVITLIVDQRSDGELEKDLILSVVASRCSSPPSSLSVCNNKNLVGFVNI